MKRFRDLYFILFAVILVATFTYSTNMGNLSSLWLWLSHEYVYLKIPLVIAVIVIIYLALHVLWGEIRNVDNKERLEQIDATQKLVRATVKEVINESGLKMLIEELPHMISKAVSEGLEKVQNEQQPKNEP